MSNRHIYILAVFGHKLLLTLASEVIPSKSGSGQVIFVLLASPIDHHNHSLPADRHGEIEGRHGDRSRVVREQVGDYCRRDAAEAGFTDTDQRSQY